MLSALTRIDVTKETGYLLQEDWTEGDIRTKSHRKDKAPVPSPFPENSDADVR